MNTEIGEIREFVELQEMFGQEQLQKDLRNQKYVPVKEEDMTEKQKSFKQVSNKDNRSKLGKKFTQIRKEKKIYRNDTCSCGSGVKYKKCCLFKNK